MVLAGLIKEIASCSGGDQDSEVALFAGESPKVHTVASQAIKPFPPALGSWPVEEGRTCHFPQLPSLSLGQIGEICDDIIHARRIKPFEHLAEPVGPEPEQPRHEYEGAIISLPFDAEPLVRVMTEIGNDPGEQMLARLDCQSRPPSPQDRQWLSTRASRLCPRRAYHAVLFA